MKKIICNILGGITAFLGIYKFIGVYEAYQMFGPLLNNAWSQAQMHHQIGLALFLCAVGMALLIIANIKSSAIKAIDTDDEGFTKYFIKQMAIKIAIPIAAIIGILIVMVIIL